MTTIVRISLFRTCMELCSNFKFCRHYATSYKDDCATTNTFRRVKCSTGKSDFATDAALAYCHQPSFPRWKTIYLARLIQRELHCGNPLLRRSSICGVNVLVYEFLVRRDVVRRLILFKWRITISYRLSSVNTALVCNVSGYFGSIKPHPFLSAASQNPRMWLDDPTATLLCLHY